MTADTLREAIQLIKAGRKVEAREILEPLLIANPNNIQAWVWEIETRDSDIEKIKLMEACLLRNPDALIIKKALAALKNPPEPAPQAEPFSAVSPFSFDESSPELTVSDEFRTGYETLLDETAISEDSILPEEPVTEEPQSPFIFEEEKIEPSTEKGTEEPISSIELAAEKPVAPFSESFSEEKFFSDETKAPFSAPIDEVRASLREKDGIKQIQCPHCGARIDLKSKSCEFCGRDLTTPEQSKEAEESRPRKKWFRRGVVKILAFIFLMPVWCLIELGDPDARKGTKVLAGILLAFFVVILGGVVYWFFAKDAAKTNLINWYKYLTAQTAEIPGGIVRVNGSVNYPGTTEFSLIELEARVYDAEGDLLGSDTRYIDASVITKGLPYLFQLDVTSLLSSLNAGLAEQQVLLYDNFSDVNSGWTNYSSEEGEAIYHEGQYRLSVNNTNYDLWSNRGVNYDNVKIEVDATKVAGPESNRFGIQCRYMDVNNYYFAIISSDGYYGIGKVVNGVQTFVIGDGMLVTDKVYAGSALNHIRFDCVGSRMSLYINGDYVDAVDDNDLSAGDVGLLAGTFETEGTQISFDNFVIINP